MKKILRVTSRLVFSATALATAISLTTAVAPAQADDGILGDAGQVAMYVGTVQQFYSLFNQYVLGQKPPSDLDQIKAAIIQSQNAIVSQIDAIATAQVQSCSVTAVEQFGNIDTMTKDTLQAFARNSVDCISMAAADIDAETDKGAIDKIGFALNIVGPIALFASADANERTDILTQDLIVANQHLMANLTPKCDDSILAPEDLPSFGEGLVTGHGACYNYHITSLPKVANFVTYIPAGPNTAFLPWYFRGDAVPNDYLSPSGGYLVFWGVRSTGSPKEDFSIAINQVMAATSYPIADAALYQLLNPVGPPGSPIAAAASNVPYAPVEALRVNGDGSVSRNEVHHSDETLSGWTSMSGRLKSVAEASNADGRLEMFGTDRVGHVFHRWQEVAADDTSWSPWAQLTGQLLTSIAVARNQNGTLQLFGTTPSGAIFTRNQVMTRDVFLSAQPVHPVPAIDGWTDWKQMDGLLTQVAAGVNQNGQVELFGINSAGNVFDCQETAPNATDPSTAGNWTGWHQLDAVLTSPFGRLARSPASSRIVDAPGIRTGGYSAANRDRLPDHLNTYTLTSIAVTSDLGGSLNIFGTNSAGTVLQRFQRGQNTEFWSAWSPVPGAAMSTVAAAKESFGGGRIDLLGIDASGHISLNTNDGIHGDSWTGWTTVPNAAAARVPPTVRKR